MLAVGFACFGITIRAWGISASGLFFDDAWFALPSRFPASKIFGMINTTPGYSLLQGVWIGLDPTSNAWAKSLALVFGIASIPAMALLGRRLGLRLLGCGGLMLLVVAAPVAIAYSVRVKQFEFDLFASIVVLILAEHARRANSWRSLLPLVFGGALIISMSTATAVVVAGSWLALLADHILSRRRCGAVVAAGAASALLALPSIAFAAVHTPASLVDYWRRAGYLLSAPFSLRRVGGLVTYSADGLFSDLTGVKVPSGFGLTGRMPSSQEIVVGAIMAAAEVSVVAWVVVSGIRAARRRQDCPERRALPSAMTLFIAAAAWAAGLVPLGAGRTDMVLLPSIFVILVIATRRLVLKICEKLESRPRLVVRSCVALGAMILAVFVGASHPALYPAQDVGNLTQSLEQRGRPDTAVVVSERNSYTWGFEGLSPFVTSIDADPPAFLTVRYSLRSKAPNVLFETVSPQGGIDVPGLVGLSPEVHRIWLVGPTWDDVGFAVPGGSKGTNSVVGRLLEGQGWTPTMRSERAEGAEAQLWRRS